ncbi:MAG: serine hydroxymethyltransferase, partial [Actinobacteria bacterium]|nr:serine hydroxymethyltransferase [Actinomycetota bacterium]
LKPEFSEYAKQTVINSARLGKGMIDGGLRLVSGGTDNHLCLVDLTPANITGKDAEHILDAVGITCNKNTIPNEKLSPSVASGIRLGMAAMTTRGIDGDEAELIGELIAYTLFNHTDASIMSDVCAKVEAILLAHPLYPELG